MVDVDPALPVRVARRARNRQRAVRTGANGQQSRHRVPDIAVDICVDEVLRRRGKSANRADELSPVRGARERIECGRGIALEHRMPFQREHRLAELGG